ncbi:cadherin-like beta sandwich domain-containing protein [Candidatus Poriferisodalis sp.]|uniref:cadherin-like beta sandwich domain-containing protein n=1 Tax=Candidatus Poriferisodalis sp. TaxID=3101277 RepID=UPI003B02C4EC
MFGGGSRPCIAVGALAVLIITLSLFALSPPPAQAQDASSDASLRDLYISGSPFTEPFDPARTEYAATVGQNQSTAYVRARVNHSEATAAVPGTRSIPGGWFIVSLDPRPANITVLVTAADGSTTRTYTIGIDGQLPASASAPEEPAPEEPTPTPEPVKRTPEPDTQPEQQQRQDAPRSSDATLSRLQIFMTDNSGPDAGWIVTPKGSAHALTPAFDPQITQYEVRIPESAYSSAEDFFGHGPRITAVVASDAPAPVTFLVTGRRLGGETRDPKRAPVRPDTHPATAEGEGEGNGPWASGPWATPAGYTWVDVKVTAADGTTAKTYSVRVEYGPTGDPRNVKLTPGDRQLTLTWEHPASGEAQNYFARWRKAGTTTWLNSGQLRHTALKSAITGAKGGTWVWSQGSSPLTYTITGLENGAEYVVELEALVGGGRSYYGHNVPDERKDDWLASGWVAARATPAEPKTELTITPASPTREYGGTDDLSYTVGGLAPGDAAAGVVTGALARATGDDTGSYAINMGTLAIAGAYADKYTLPSSPSVATYAITAKEITAVSGVTVNSRTADGTTDATFDTGNARGTGVLSSELADFRAGGLQVSGTFNAATAGTHDVSVTYSLQDHGSFKASNYTLASTTDTLRGEITAGGIYLSPNEDDGVLRFSEGRMIGDSSIVGFTKLIRPVTVAQGMTAVHYIALKHPPTADVTIYLKSDPPSFFEKASHVQRTAHFSAGSYQPGAVGEALGYIVTRDAIGTFTITHVGVSDDPRYNGDLDTLTVQVIRAKPGECRTLAAPSVIMDESGEVWATSGPAACAGRIVDGYQLEVSENGGPWKQLDAYLTPHTPGRSKKPTSKAFREAGTLPDSAVNGSEYRVRGRGYIVGKYPRDTTDWLTTSFAFTGKAAVIIGAPVRQPGVQLPNGSTDYDVDNDGLIEVSTLAQLNAMRWDPDGNGYAYLLEPYAAAFPDAMNGMGCPSSWCSGYELANDLDFDTNGNGEADAGDAYWNGGAGWHPVGVACWTWGSVCLGSGPFSGVFEGNGNVIRNLYLNRTSSERTWWRNRSYENQGLFGASRGIIRNVGLESVNVAGMENVGGLVGLNKGRIIRSYVTGSVTGLHAVGGLVGLSYVSGTIVESYSTASVVGRMPQSLMGRYIGGLVGFNDDGAVIASYAAGRVSGQALATGGLIGYGSVKSSVTASYSTSVVSSWGSLTTGLGRGGDAVSSYWDTQTSGQSGSSLGVGKTTAELQAPTGYTGIYANWNRDLDGDGNADDPWDFGTGSQYPVLKNAGPSVAGQRPGSSDDPAAGQPADSPSAFGDKDYDADDDGLIDVSGLGQLNAIRWDLDGDGSPGNNEYYAYFPDAMADMGCPSSGCVGYELTASLDFDTDASGGANSADAYWNGGAGWTPIGYGPDDGPIDHGVGDFSAVFEGNDFAIRSLFVSSTGDGAGLFSGIASGGTVRSLTLESVGVTAVGQVGGLVGRNAGSISGVSVSGEVTGRNSVGGVAGASVASGVITAGRSTASVTGTKPRSEGGRDVGGLVGYNEGAVRASYAAGAVSGRANNTGGLVGFNSGAVIASYARLDVTGSGRYIGGLAGSHYAGAITASYAAGATAGGTDAGGLVGHRGGSITASYWDSDESQAAGPGGEGKTTSELQTPTGYTGIYANWNADLDGDGSADDPWDFGTSCQYPVLKHGGLSPDDQSSPCGPATVKVEAAPVEDAPVEDAPVEDAPVEEETVPEAPPTPGQTEPYNVRVTPGDGTLTVTWTVAPREGLEDDAIRHALRWSQQSGVWANPPGPSGAHEDGIVVEGGVASYTITGLQNGVATGVFVRSFTDSSYSERSEHSSQWIRVKGEHTTPKAAG